MVAKSNQKPDELSVGGHEMNTIVLVFAFPSPISRSAGRLAFEHL